MQTTPAALGTMPAIVLRSRRRMLAARWHCDTGARAQIAVAGCASPSYPGGAAGSAAGHRDFPRRFRAVVRTLLLCARRPDCVVAKLPADALLHIVSVLARVWFWECR